MTDVLYTAEALSTGGGRNGHVRTTDGRLDMDMAVPKEMGGSGSGANPELMFAAGYAACFHSAVQGIARSKKVDVKDSSVGSRVQILPNGQGGYQLAVHLEVTLPGVEQSLAQEIADAAHQVCRNAPATRGNIEVAVEVTDH